MDQESFVKQILSIDPSLVAHISPRLQNNLALAYEIVSQDPQTLILFPMNVRTNPVIVDLAVEKDPMSLRYAGPIFKDCKDTVTKAT